MIRLKMKNYNMLVTEKVSALSSVKNIKYEYLTCEEILLLIKNK